MAALADSTLSFDEGSIPVYSRIYTVRVQLQYSSAHVVSNFFVKHRYIHALDHLNLIGHVHIPTLVTKIMPEWPDPPSECWWCNTSSAAEGVVWSMRLDKTLITFKFKFESYVVQCHVLHTTLILLRLHHALTRENQEWILCLLDPTRSFMACQPNWEGVQMVHR